MVLVVLRDIGAVSNITLPSLPKMIDCRGREEASSRAIKWDRTSLTRNLIPMLSGNPPTVQVLRGTIFCTFTCCCLLQAKRVDLSRGAPDR